MIHPHTPPFRANAALEQAYDHQAYLQLMSVYGPKPTCIFTTIQSTAKWLFITMLSLTAILPALVVAAVLSMSITIGSVSVPSDDKFFDGQAQHVITVRAPNEGQF